jgi:hypothetical protein
MSASRCGHSLVRWPTPHGGKSASAHALPLPPRVVLVRPTTIAACTDSGDSTVTDRASRTRGDESLRPISGCAKRRRAPTATGQGYVRDACRMSSANAQPRLMCVAGGRAEHGVALRSRKSGAAIPPRVFGDRVRVVGVGHDALSRATEDASSELLDARRPIEYERD